MKHFLLFYDYVDDFMEKRQPYRADHLAHAKASVGRGDMELAGALVNEAGGVFLFKAETAANAEAFAAGDPYVIYGIVKSWRVREWTTTVGPGALTKI